MALIVCTECGHKISSLARFCPKCNHLKVNTVHNTSSLYGSDTSAVDIPGKVTSENKDFHGAPATSGELLQSEFKPSLDEMIILEGKTFLVKGFFKVSDCYAYLTSKRLAFCDTSGVNIEFQIGTNGIASIEEGRHLVTKIITITTVSGENIRLKSQPHSEWFSALLDPKRSAVVLNKTKYDQVSTNNSSIDWYYEDSGINIGPIKEKVIIQIILNNHTIFRNTKVWNSSLPEWKRAEETILTIYFSESAASLGGLKQEKKGFSLLHPGLFPKIKWLCRKYF